MSDQGPRDGGGHTADLVAFEVEGSGYYLVPLTALALFEVDTSSSRRSFTPMGWGWSLPIVRWNTFHSSQVGSEITLGPNVTARLAAHHFNPSQRGDTTS